MGNIRVHTKIWRQLGACNTFTEWELQYPSHHSITKVEFIWQIKTRKFASGENQENAPYVGLMLLEILILVMLLPPIWVTMQNRTNVVGMVWTAWGHWVTIA